MDVYVSEKIRLQIIAYYVTNLHTIRVTFLAAGCNSATSALL